MWDRIIYDLDATSIFASSVTLLLCAAFLCGAAQAYNSFVGGSELPRSVPEPTFVRALWIMFAVMVVNFVLSFFIAIWGMAKGMTAAQGEAFAPLFSVPMNLLVLPIMFAFMLPTTFGRACLVFLCWLVISVVLSFMLWLMLFVILFVIRMI